MAAYWHTVIPFEFDRRFKRLAVAVSISTDLLTNLAAALIGSIIALSWRSARTWFRFRGMREFWMPFSGDRAVVVFGQLRPDILLTEDALLDLLAEAVADHRHRDAFHRIIEYLGRQENSGLIGYGDLQAYIYVNTRLSQSTLAPVLEHLRSDEGQPAPVTRNLILIGGEDVNPTTRDLLHSLGCTYRNQLVDGRNSVTDESLGELLQLRDEAGGPRDGELLIDRGILVWAPRVRLDGARRAVLILAGAQGIGTLAAAKVAFDKQEDLKRLRRDFPNGFECMVRCVRELTADKRLRDERIDLFWPKALPAGS